MSDTKEPRRWIINVKLRDIMPPDYIYESTEHWDSNTIVEVIEASWAEARIRELEETLNEVEVLKADYGTCSAHRDTLEAENERLKVYVIDPLRVDIEILEKQIKELEARIEKLQSENGLQNSENAKLKNRIQNLRAALEVVMYDNRGVNFDKAKEALAEDEEGTRE